MTKRFYKHKLLLDENFPIRSALPLLNKRYDLKHIAADYDQAGISDPKVYEIACKESRILITYNIKDFRELAQTSNDAGVIGVSPNLTLEQIDRKLTSLLNKSTKRSLFGKLTPITGET